MEDIQTAVQTLKGLKLSQAQIAKIAGVSQMTISRWLAKGPRRVDTAALRRMTKFLEKVRIERAEKQKNLED